MKFNTEKEFKDAFAFEFYEQFGVERNDVINEYAFLDLYLRIAECKKIVFSRSQEIFLFPDYGKQIYEPGIDSLFKQLDRLIQDCGIPQILHLFSETQLLTILRASSSIEETDFASRYLIQTNHGIINTITRKKVKDDVDGVFTATHQIDKPELSKAHPIIKELFESIANRDTTVMKQLYMIAYLTLIGHGCEHLTLLTGKHSYNKQAFLLLLRALASKDASEKISFRDLSIDDNLYMIGNLRSLYYNPEILRNSKCATTAKELLTNVVKNRYTLITRKYMQPVLFYHRGMNVHCTERVCDEFFEMQDLSENVWEVEIKPNSVNLTHKRINEIVSEFDVLDEEHLIEHPAFTRYLISTVLYTVNNKFKIDVCDIESLLQKHSQSAKRARIAQAQQLAKDTTTDIE